MKHLIVAATTATRFAVTAAATAAGLGAITVGSRVAPRPPPDAETTCGPLRHGGDDLLVWAIRREHTGLDYFLGRFDRHGRPRGPALEVGWGYDGNPVCALAANRGRIAIVFPFFDPYGGTPALTITIVDGDRIVAKRDFVKRTMCWDFEPVSIRSTADGGWVVYFRCADDAPVERITLDRDGR